MNKKRILKFIVGLAFLTLPLSACDIPDYTNGNGTGNNTNQNSGNNNNNSGDNSNSTNKELLAIRITKEPTKKSYIVGDQLDLTGLEVQAAYSGGVKETIDNKDLDVSGFDSQEPGTKTVVVSFTHESITKTGSFTVSVKRQTNNNEDGKDVTLDFYTMNDLHGNVLDTTMGVGIAKVSTLLKQKTQNQNSILISSGDMWQGTLESNSTRGELMTKWMEYIGFSAMTVGNHEFDWGKEYIKTNAEKYNLPILGINIVDLNTGKQADYVTSSTIVERDGAKIGIIGAVGDCYSSISYSKVMDVKFVIDEPQKDSYPLTDLVKAESNRLREQEGCDFIVFSVHGDTQSGDTYYNPDLSAGGYVDLVLEGHTHRQVHYVDDGGVHHFQCQASGAISINHISVNLNTGTDQYTIDYSEDSDTYYLNTYDKQTLTPDQGTLDIINYYDFSPYYVPIGINNTVRYSSELKQMCANEYLEYGLKKWSSYADRIVLAGGYISVRGNGRLNSGEITYADLYTLFPFDNDVMLITLSGSSLKSAYFNTTNENYFMGYTSYGNSLKNDQSLVDGGQRYYLITDTYSYDWFLKVGHQPVLVDVYSETGTYARDILADYAKKGGFGGVIDNGNQQTTENDGSLEHPFTVLEALRFAEQFSTIDESREVYCVGTVSSAGTRLGSYNDIGNVYISDAFGNEMLIYFLRKFANATPEENFQSITEIEEGDELLICGKPFYYNETTFEFGYGTYCVTINGVSTDPRS